LRLDSQKESVFPQSSWPFRAITRGWKNVVATGASPERVALDCFELGRRVERVCPVF
jgi:hypothetical protein